MKRILNSRTTRLALRAGLALTLLNLAGCPGEGGPNEDPNSPVQNETNTNSSAPTQEQPKSDPTDDTVDPSTPVDPTPPAGIALGQLQDASTTRTVIELNDKIPSFVETRVPVPDTSSGDDALEAISFFDKYKDLYKLIEPASQLYLVRAELDEDGEHLFFGQQQDGVVVFGAELAIHLKDGYVLGTNGRYLPTIPVFGSEMLGGD